MITDNHRLIFRSLEKLQVQFLKSVTIDFVDMENRLDLDFEPGLFKKTGFFLKNTAHPNFVNICQHRENVIRLFKPIAHPVNI